MIGNAQEAAFIHNWYHGTADADRESPDGWEYLGEGCYRAAYLSPSGVVYKVQKDESGDSWQTNYGEWRTWKRLYLTCKMPQHSRLPKLTYYPTSRNGEVGVIAIEYIDGDYEYYGTFRLANGDLEYWSTVCRDITRATGVGDLYSDNLRIDTKSNLLVPTDLGCSSSDY